MTNPLDPIAKLAEISRAYELASWRKRVDISKLPTAGAKRDAAKERLAARADTFLTKRQYGRVLVRDHLEPSGLLPSRLQLTEVISAEYKKTQRQVGRKAKAATTKKSKRKAKIRMYEAERRAGTGPLKQSVKIHPYL